MYQRKKQRIIFCNASYFACEHIFEGGCVDEKHSNRAPNPDWGKYWPNAK